MPKAAGTEHVETCAIFDQGSCDGDLTLCDCVAQFKPGPIEKRECLCGAIFFEADPTPEQFPGYEGGLFLCERCAPTLEVGNIVNWKGRAMPALPAYMG